MGFILLVKGAERISKKFGVKLAGSAQLMHNLTANELHLANLLRDSVIHSHGHM